MGYLSSVVLLELAAAVAGLAIYAAAMSGCGHASDSPGDAAAHEHEEEGPPPTEADIDMPHDYPRGRSGESRSIASKCWRRLPEGHPHECTAR